MEVADFQTKTYAKDTSAEAVVLCDYGQTEFMYNNERGFQTKFERTTRVCILKKSGYDWATVEVPLYQSNAKEGEKLTDLKGYTYNLQNGQVVKEKMAKEAVFLEKKDENHLIQKFTLPNVKEGSVIEANRLCPVARNSIFQIVQTSGSETGQTVGFGLSGRYYFKNGSNGDA